MPRLLPFRGLRPNPAIALLSDVVCPPYDVINGLQRAELIARSPYNVVRVELPAGDYAGAAALLAKWERDGVLRRDAEPALYAYRMSYRDPTGKERETLGAMGALVLEAPGHGILPHEQTTPKDKTDRLELIRATRANTSPIWCLCSEPGLSKLLGEAGPSAPKTGAAASALDEDGVTHEIWPLYDPAVHQAVARLTSAAPLLVADGHHRYETALAYMAETNSAASAGDTLRQGAGDAASTAPGGPGRATGGLRGEALARRSDALGPAAVMSLVVELSDQSLQVMAIHRTVSNLPAGSDPLSAFRDEFILSTAVSVGPGLLDEMAAAGAVGVVTPAGAFLAVPRPGSLSATFDVDSSRVDAALVGLPPHQLHYEHDLAGALAGVREGRLNAAVLCRPASVAQIAAIARGGARMPPKTTFFWPKPRTGMVFRDM
jgi:uncharacterized protein (DUF1015 family)